MFATNFKTKRSGKVDRKLRAIKRKAGEDAKKQEVRRRDRFCRFPLCGCKRFNLLLHVSHQVHKGMGGNPKGDRSIPELMLLACSARHRENRISIDQKTLRWRALDQKAGANGPIVWEVDARELPRELGGGRAAWLEVARERSIHVYEPLTPNQAAILKHLAEMLV